MAAKVLSPADEATTKAVVEKIVREGFWASEKEYARKCRAGAELLGISSSDVERLVHNRALSQLTDAAVARWEEAVSLGNNPAYRTPGSEPSEEEIACPFRSLRLFDTERARDRNLYRMIVLELMLDDYAGRISRAENRDASFIFWEAALRGAICCRGGPPAEALENAFRLCP